ncbi:hypothetical protein [Metaplanococcus flavidus]|uniref:Uncharacterized protein n=1 Tax=Metaplanococcus flavidus TaxID=569883 RepID=A0ABW3LFK4_9BACL
MSKEEFFTLSFEQKCHFIFTVRQKLFDANTVKEREAALPDWIIEMVQEFEDQYKFKGFAALLLGSFLLLRNCEENEEIVCILNEIHDQQLHLIIAELEKLWNLSWTRRFELDDN